MITSGPSDGSVREIRKRNSQAPSGTPIAPPAAPAARRRRHGVRSPGRRRADGAEHGDVALALANGSGSVVSRFTSATASSSATCRRRPAAAWRSPAAATRSGADVERLPAWRERRARPRARRPRAQADRPVGVPSVAAPAGRLDIGGTPSRPSLSGSMWRPTARSVTGRRATRQRHRPADPHAEVLERGAAERRLARRARRRGRRGSRTGTRAAGPRARAAAAAPPRPQPGLIHARDGRDVAGARAAGASTRSGASEGREADVPRLRAQGGVRADAVGRRLEAHRADQHGGGEREAAERQAGAAAVRERVLGAEPEHDRKAQRARPAGEPRAPAGAGAAPERERLGRRDAPGPARGDRGRRGRRPRASAASASSQRPGPGIPGAGMASACAVSSTSRARAARRPAGPAAPRSAPGRA